MTDLHKILLKHWGYNAFRPTQEEIIRSVLDNRDTLALLPTGGGKSICFQVPVLAKEGIGLVVTPLIALMKDQIENLKARNIRAAAVYSGMHPHEIEIAINNATHGLLKFLYLSPERLETDLIKANITKMKVSLIAVDEAHCISQWGYDFRPSYLNIARIRKYIPGVPVLALTATATPAVVKDIQEKLEFPAFNLFQQSFERKNLTYVVLKEEDKLNRLLKVIRNVKGSGIVYLRSRRRTREIAEFLGKNGITADFYHAGLDNQTRSLRQEAWKKGKTRIMVATNAFGMGIDKPDVRFVVHLDIPETLESYFQEAGRAGRDGKQSYGVMMFHPSDIPDVYKTFEQQFPPVKTIRQIYHALGNYFNIAIGSGKDVSFDFDFNSFCNNYNFQAKVAASSLKFLEKEGFISLQDLNENESKLFICASKDDLYRFQVKNVSFDPLIKTVLRSYSGLFTEFTSVSESEIARRMGSTEKIVEKMLIDLEKMEILVYRRKKTLPQLCFITERFDGSSISISNHHYHDRKESAKNRMQGVIDYLETRTKCRSQQLLEYFDENKANRCGKCDVCIERNKVDLSELEFDMILNIIKPLLQNSPLFIKELSEKVGIVNGDKTIKVVQWLLDNHKVIYDDSQKLTWKGK
jgi:ATP-dependent DNA helicase RecQ